MEYSPALPILRPWLTSNEMTRTARKIIVLVINIDKRKFQLTELKSRLDRFPKIIAGKANVPTNVPMPLDSLVDNSLNLNRNNKEITANETACVCLQIQHFINSRFI